MQDRMNQHMQQQNGFNGTGTQAGKTTEKKDEAGDYIEFEEVK
jgi:hypothetical protein